METKAELLKLLEERKRRFESTRLTRYRPYTKQRQFHALGATCRERLLIAGNQLGKTLAGAAEMAMHLSGEYPDWWDGKRFDGPIIAMAGSESSELTRDGVQKLLLGPPDDETQWGTGYIPAAAIVGQARRQGVPDAVDSITVKHKSGLGNSTILFKSYDQGRKKWQANTVHVIWFDEEPPFDIYMEGMTRTNVHGGPVYLTFTPLMGMSEVVRRYLMDPSSDRASVTMTIDDAEHYTPEQRAKIIATYPPHEREARIKGIPSLGSGRIFPVSEESITIAPFPIPSHFARLGALDFGWDHPTAGVEIAWDRDADIIIVTRCYREREKTPMHHAGVLRQWGEALRWAWPHDGLQHSKDSGEQLKDQYRKHGLNMLDSHATFEDGTIGVEAGLFEMLTRMESGTFKVFSTCADWFEEFRLYHRKDGKVVKEADDLLSATRYAVMSRRFAVPFRSKIETWAYAAEQDDPFA